MAQAQRLTATQIEVAPAGKHADGGGLTLVVKPTGRRSWVARLTVDGKRRDIGLGAYPGVSLDDARLRAAELRAEANGCDDGSPSQLVRRRADVR